MNGMGFFEWLTWFFGQIALTWFWSPAEPLVETPRLGVPDIPTAEPSERVLLVLREVKHGWTPETVLDFWGGWYALAVLFGLVLSAVMLYCVIRIRQIREEERRARLADVRPVAARDVSRTELRWQRVLEQVSSDDDHKWRLAILEADIMLNDLLDTLGLRGETMSDKMKQVGRDKFNTIDLAWEAHRVRNRVAHEGSEHGLTAREARRVIRMYEQVFREFRYIE